MTVLIIAPHMDDEVLGAGGTIGRHLEAEDTVHVCFVAHRIYDHRLDEERNRVECACARDAQAVLGYQEAIFLDLPDERLDAALQDVIVPLERVVADVQPDVVYLPHRGDNHQDHRAVFDAARVVLRPAATPRVRRVLCYEIASSTEQSPPIAGASFVPNLWVDMARHLDRKIEALRCYASELRCFPHPRSPEGVRTLAAYRGMASGFAAAEAFMVLRDRWC